MKIVRMPDSSLLTLYAHVYDVTDEDNPVLLDSECFTGTEDEAKNWIQDVSSWALSDLPEELDSDKVSILVTKYEAPNYEYDLPVVLAMDEAED